MEEQLGRESREEHVGLYKRKHQPIAGKLRRASTVDTHSLNAQRSAPVITTTPSYAERLAMLRCFLPLSSYLPIP